MRFAAYAAFMSLLFALPEPAISAPITWDFVNTDFPSGDVTGSFTYDADSGAVTDVDIVTPDGVSFEFTYGAIPEIEFHFIFNSVANPVGPGTYALWLYPSGGDSLTDAGGTIAIGDLIEESCVDDECGDYGVVASTSSGELVAQTAPEPSSTLLAILPLAAFCAWVSRRQILPTAD
jgi:hypothetical protein